MATIFKNAGGELREDPPNIAGKLRGIPRLFERGLFREAGTRIGTLVRNAIVEGTKTNNLGLAPLSNATLATRRLGKPGVFPIRKPVTHDAPLWQTGQLLNSYRLIPGDRQTKLGYFGLTHNYSKLPMAELAAIHTKGFTRRVKLTPRMAHYLKIVYGEGKGGKGGGKTKRARVRSTKRNWKARTFQVTVPARNAWSRGFDRVAPQLKMVLRNFVKTVVGPQIGLRIRTRG